MRENRKCFQSHAYDMHLLEIKSTNCGARLSLEVRKKNSAELANIAVPEPISEHWHALTNRQTSGVSVALLLSERKRPSCN